MEKRVIKKAMKGDAQAFETLLLQNKEQLYRTAYLYTGNQQDSLDIIQETSFKAFKAIKTLKEPKYFKTWLIKILINTAMSFNKKKASIIFMDEIEEKNMQSISPSSHSDEHMDLLQGIEQLRESYRQVILLHYYHEMTVKEIAGILEIPEGTVKTNLVRGREELKKMLEGGKSNERQAN